MKSLLRIAALIVAGACAVIALLVGANDFASPIDLLAIGVIALVVAIVAPSA